MANPTSRAELLRRIEQVVRAVPAGKVIAYSRVALLAGIPGGARQVAKAMRALSHVPWWRVVRADLTLAKEVAVGQARRLKREGVETRGRRVPRTARASLSEITERLHSRRR